MTLRIDINKLHNPWANSINQFNYLESERSEFKDELQGEEDGEDYIENV